MKTPIIKTSLSLIAGAAVLLTLPSISSAQKIAVWLDGSTTDGGNPIVANLNTEFGAGAAQLVTTAQLDTPGFLNSFQAVVVSRYDASFGTYLDATAAANIKAYVGAPGPSQGGVALFSNDMADNLAGSSSGDPYDANLQALFNNAAKYAVLSGHGYIGEFNGAAQAMAANTFGAAPIGLLPGTADSPGAHGSSAEQFTYAVGPIGAGNPIDVGVTFPFTDSDATTFLTVITGADPNNIVDIYTDPKAQGDPAVLANSYVIQGGQVPEVASTWLLLSIGLAGLLGLRRKQQAG